MRLPCRRRARMRAVTAVLAAAAVLCACGQPPPPTSPPPAPGHAAPSPAPVTPLPPVAPDPAFAPIAPLVDAAIAAHRLPGAVVQVGHAGTIVYRQAFGDRKLAGEPGLDGRPSPAEAMTADTLFDLASLTKCLATAVAVLQLVEAGRVEIDEPVQTYLPEFNTDDDPRRAAVTLRMLLTHTSGIGGDLSHQGPWGLTHPDKDDGVHRALTAPLEFDPGERFHYSDIGFIILGALVEKLTGEALDRYVPEHVFAPLHMADTHYLPVAKACGPHEVRGAVIAPDPDGEADTDSCPDASWSTALLARIAPTAHDGDTAGINPDFGQLLRGTVHDPTARRMGGVAGSAGVFSTVHDVGLFAQALLDRLAGRPSPFPLSTATLAAMTSPQQPGHTPEQLAAANAATRAAVAATPGRPDPLLAPAYPAIGGQDLRGFGWDIDTPHSAPRGVVFPIGSVGHTGFTGVTAWIDPGSDTYVVVLANVIHQPGGPPISSLSGEIATLAARALHLYGS